MAQGPDPDRTTAQGVAGLGASAHFAAIAAAYAAFRPTYPAALFEHIARASPRHARALDCGTGNGQAAHGLAAHFRRVLATDLSPGQLRQAAPHARVCYAAMRAERTALPNRCMDCVTVAQALHWLPLAEFYAEARRVLNPGGILAVWCYGRVELRAELNPPLQAFSDAVAPYWPRERSMVDRGYRDVPFPFKELPALSIRLEQDWTLAALLGYAGTWSAVARFRAATGTDPVARLRAELARRWGDPGALERVWWPLSLRMGRV